jgi:sulfhydrogenase subunit alpha
MNTIEVPALARVEGEGGLLIEVKGGKVVDVKLNIYEPPRFFEGFLVGRYFQDVPDITARICGICPVAYQMSSVAALEAALGIEIPQQVYDLRHLMYCGEYIESHALHIYLLQAPDLLGQPSAFELAAIAPDVVKNALRMKKAGNAILSTIGGRSVHPVNACVGGFYSWPNPDSIKSLLPELKWGLKTAQEAVRWAVTLPYPDLDVDYEFVAIHHPKEYGVMRGEVWSSRGSRISPAEFEKQYIEEHVQHSNALHGHTKDGDNYLVGPLARLALNHEQLNPQALKMVKEVGLKLPIRNPFMGLVARAVELVHYFEEAINLVKKYQPEGPACMDFELKTGEGSGVSEAPRGLLYHRYSMNEKGGILSARIVPPTAQNLPRIEADLYSLAPSLLKQEQEQATLTAEHLVRSYDPCISCATHFLKLRVQQRD